METLPIGAWWKVQEDLNFKHLINKQSTGGKIYFFFIPIISDITIKSSQVWEEIRDTYIKYIGMESEFMELTKCRLELKDLICDRIITGDRFINNLIKVKEGQIEAIRNALTSAEGVSNDESIIILEEQRKLAIDINKMSVKKYYDLVKYYTDKQTKEVETLAA